MTWAPGQSIPLVVNYEVVQGGDWEVQLSRPDLPVNDPATASLEMRWDRGTLVDPGIYPPDLTSTGNTPEIGLTADANGVNATLRLSADVTATLGFTSTAFQVWLTADGYTQLIAEGRVRLVRRLIG